MTMEEAISVLHKLKPTIRRVDGKSTTHILETIALNMAIKALEQEPCEDCISRADAFRVAKNEYLRGWHNALCKALSEKYLIHCEEGNFSVIQEETITGLGLSMDCAVGKDVESYMSDLPSVTPARKKEEWIPCNERLPEKNGRYIVTRGLKACGSLWNRVYIANYSDLMGLCKEKIWWSGNVGKSDFERHDDVLAWMPLPEPYKAESEDNK